MQYLDAGLMTGKLYSIFLTLFDDEHIHTREAVCSVCQKLRISDKIVIDKLLQVVSYDVCSRIRAMAVRALREICLAHKEVFDERIRSALVWSFKYETLPSMRSEACSTLVALNLCLDTEVRPTFGG